MSTKEETSSPAGVCKMPLSCPLSPTESFVKSLLAWQPPQARAEGGPGSGPWARPGRAAWGKLGSNSPPRFPSPAGRKASLLLARGAQTWGCGEGPGLSHFRSF